MREDVELLLIGVHHDEDIHEIISSVVLRVLDDIGGQFSSKMVHTGLFLLYFRIDFDEGLINDFIFIPEQS